MTGWARVALALVLGHVLAPYLAVVVAAEVGVFAATIAAVAVLAARARRWRGGWRWAA